MNFNRQDSKTRLKPLDDQKMFEILRKSSDALEIPPNLSVRRGNFVSICGRAVDNKILSRQ